MKKNIIKHYYFITLDGLRIVIKKDVTLRALNIKKYDYERR
jgi:hypothetical protein